MYKLDFYSYSARAGFHILIHFFCCISHVWDWIWTACFMSYCICIICVPDSFQMHTQGLHDHLSSSSPLHQDWTRHLTLGNRIQRAKACLRDRYWSQWSGSHKRPSHTIATNAEGLGWFHVSFPAVHAVSVSSYKFRSSVATVFPSWYWPWLAHINPHQPCAWP